MNLIDKFLVILNQFLAILNNNQHKYFWSHSNPLKINSVTSNLNMYI